ncbi:hypothetical protein [Flavobacterium beibuense]|uniref:hypothetical protein n=1 Tax=Flavobacterium beibuense TaxID=657326 RepID=UPI003A8E9A08
MVDAMSYEYLLRRIYQVGRYGKENVDADIYRNLEDTEALYRMDLENIEKKQPRISVKKIDDLEYDYRVESRKIWSIITEAIRKGNSKYSYTFTKNEITTLENLLIEPTMITKEHIDNIIEIAQNIYIKHKIYPA